MNHPQLSPMFSEDEQRVLQYLKNFYIEEFEDIKNGYKILLQFDPNPYFENETLFKEYHMAEPEPIQKVETIKWKPGKNFLSTAPVEKDSRKRKTQETFFSWFTSAESSHLDEIADVCSLQKCYTWLVNLIHLHFFLLQWLKDDLWTNPLAYFMLPSIEEDDDEEEDESGGEEEDSDEKDSDENDSEAGSAVDDERRCEN